MSTIIMPEKKFLLGRKPKVDISKLFKITTYTGNNDLGSGSQGPSADIINGMDFAGKGGMLMTATRTTGRGAPPFLIHDTDRPYTAGSPAGGPLRTIPYAQTSDQTTPNDLSRFLSNGYQLGYDPNGYVNYPGDTYFSYSFIKAKKFLDIVLYTGNGVAGRKIPHNLGAKPGMILIRQRNGNTGSAKSTKLWMAGANFGTNAYFDLASMSGAGVSSAALWNGVAPTSTEITINSNVQSNENGATYIMYIFAGDTDANDMLFAGVYTGPGNAINSINIGWEPQMLYIKANDGLGGHLMIDGVRGWYRYSYIGSYPEVGTSSPSLQYITPNANGFTINTLNNADFNNNGQYFFFAVRKAGV